MSKPLTKHRITKILKRRLKNKDIDPNNKYDKDHANMIVDLYNNKLSFIEGLGISENEENKYKMYCLNYIANVYSAGTIEQSLTKSIVERMIIYYENLMRKGANREDLNDYKIALELVIYKFCSADKYDELQINNLLQAYTKTYLFLIKYKYNRKTNYGFQKIKDDTEAYEVSKTYTKNTFCTTEHTYMYLNKDRVIKIINRYKNVMNIDEINNKFETVNMLSEAKYRMDRIEQVINYYNNKLFDGPNEKQAIESTWFNLALPSINTNANYQSLSHLIEIFEECRIKNRQNFIDTYVTNVGSLPIMFNTIHEAMTIFELVLKDRRNVQMATNKVLTEWNKKLSPMTICLILDSYQIVNNEITHYHNETYTYDDLMIQEINGDENYLNTLRKLYTNWRNQLKSKANEHVYKPKK